MPPRPASAPGNAPGNAPGAAYAPPLTPRAPPGAAFPPPTYAPQPGAWTQHAQYATPAAQYGQMYGHPSAETNGYHSAETKPVQPEQDMVIVKAGNAWKRRLWWMCCCSGFLGAIGAIMSLL